MYISGLCIYVSTSDSKYLMLTDSDGVAPPAKRTRVSLDPTPATFSFSDSSLNDLPVVNTPEYISSLYPPLLPLPPPPITVLTLLYTIFPSSPYHCPLHILLTLLLPFLPDVAAISDSGAHQLSSSSLLLLLLLSHCYLSLQWHDQSRQHKHSTE